MLNNKQGAPKAKFLLPKMSSPSLILNEDEDFPEEKELSIPEMNLSDDDSFMVMKTKIVNQPKLFLF